MGAYLGHYGNEALSCKTLGAFANKPEHVETVCMHMHSSNSYRARVTTRMQCSCGITRYYVITTDHVCAKSAELVHIEVKKLTEFTVFSDESVEL